MSLPANNACGAAKKLPSGVKCECIGIMRAETLPDAASDVAKKALALRLVFPSAREEERFVRTATQLLETYRETKTPLPSLELEK